MRSERGNGARVRFTRRVWVARGGPVNRRLARERSPARLRRLAGHIPPPPVPPRRISMTAYKIRLRRKKAKQKQKTIKEKAKAARKVAGKRK